MLLCFAGCFCFGEDGLSFKVRIPISEQGVKPEIQKETGRIRTEKRLPNKKVPKLKAGTLAERIGDSGLEIVWIPSWEDSGSGKTRLKSVSISRDASILFCIEETGKFGTGPFGALLLLIDPVGKRILNYHELNRKATGIAADSTGTQAVCFTEAQPLLKQEAGFQVLNLKTGKEVAFHSESRPVFSYLLRNNKLFVSYADGTLESLDLKSRRKQRVRPGMAAKLELTGNGSSLIAASGDAVRFYDPDRLKLLDTVPLPGGSTVYRVIPGDSNGSTMFLSTNPGFGKSRLYLIYNRSVKLVTNDSSGEIAYNPNDMMLFSGRFIKNRVYKIDPVAFSDLSYCDPKNLRPVTGGSTRFLFRGPDEGEIIIVDTRSSVYSLKNIRRRWVKKVIVESGLKK